MKKLITIILILISLSSYGQTPPRTGYLVQPAKGKFVNPIWLDSGAYITKIPKYGGQNRYLVYDSITGKVGYRFVAASGGTVTSVAALTLGTTGTDLSSTVANGTTTPAITLNVPTASASNRGALSSTDWSTFNNKLGSLTAGNGILVSGSTIYNDSTKFLSLYGYGGANGTFIGTVPNRSLRFRSNGLQRMLLDSNGYVGINTTTPQFGTLEIKQKTDNASGGIAVFSADGTTRTGRFWVSNSGVMYLESGGTGAGDIVMNTGAGRIILGGSVGSGKLSIPVAPTASANYGLFSMSNTTTAFDGSTSGKFNGASNGQYIGINSVGSVAYNYVDFQKNGVSRFKVDSLGSVNTIGNMTITGNFLGNVCTATGGSKIGAAQDLTWLTRSGIQAPSSGVLLLTDAPAYTSFNRLQFGGQTSSFPSLQRSGADIIVRLADNSADAKIRAANFYSGSYTPTITGVTNITSSTAYTTSYTRTDSSVTVYGQVSITPTANNTRTTFGVSLPIASNFSNAYQAGGNGYTIANTTAGHGMAIYSDATNDRVEFDYYETHSAPDTFAFTFTYKIR